MNEKDVVRYVYNNIEAFNIPNHKAIDLSKYEEMTHMGSTVKLLPIKYIQVLESIDHTDLMVISVAVDQQRTCMPFINVTQLMSN